MSRFAPSVWAAIALLAWSLLATVVAIVEKLPYEFGGRGDPDTVAGDSITSGTALSAPLTALGVLVLATALAAASNRRMRTTGRLLFAFLAVVFTIAGLGEDFTPGDYEGLGRAVLTGFKVVGLALAVAMGVLAVVELVRGRTRVRL